MEDDLAEATSPAGFPLPTAPLMGREAELDRLRAALGRVVQDHSSAAITVVGGAGVGKSRLLGEFLTIAAAHEPPVRTLRGISRSGGPALGALQQVLRARFGLSETAAPAAAREALRVAVTDLLDDQRVTDFLHFLGAYLEVTFPESPFTKALEDDAEQLGRVSRAVLRRFLEVDAQSGPMILVFEQLHEADDETIDLVAYLARTLADAPILLVVGARPELLASWPEFCQGERHERLDLGPLSPPDAAGMVRALLSGVEAPPDALIEAAVEMAGGSPYLLEQAVRLYFDGGTLTHTPGGGVSVDLERLDHVQLPLTVDDAIAARLSALSPVERELLERAATMGSVFWLGALVSLGRLDRESPHLWGGGEDLAGHYRDLLNGLAARDYVMGFPDSSIPGEVEYAFKHNLEHDALYRLIGKSDAARYHRRIAEWLELRLDDRGEEACELLASHFEPGGANAQAARYTLAAADRARARFANARAAELYERGLCLLGGADVVRELEARHHHGDVLQLLGRYDAALGEFRRMLTLAFRLDHRSKGGAAHNRIGRVYRAIGQLEEAMRHLGTGHALFDAADDTRGVASSLDDVAKVHWMRGAYDSAERFAREALSLRRELGQPRSIALSLNTLGLALHDSGRFDEAVEAFSEALELRRKVADAPGLAQSLNNLGTVRQDVGDHAGAEEIWREALEVARRVGDRMSEAIILTNLGECAYRLGDAPRAIEILLEAEALGQTLGDRILEGEIHRGLAVAHTLLGDLSAARRAITRSVELFRESKSLPFLGAALRTLGEVEQGGGAPAGHAAAERAFRDSLALFEQVGNEAELGKTANRLAALLERTAEGDAARLEEAAELRARADEVQGRQLASGLHALPPLEDEKTDPSITQPTS